MDKELNFLSLYLTRETSGFKLWARGRAIKAALVQLHVTFEPWLVCAGEFSKRSKESAWLFPHKITYKIETATDVHICIFYRNLSLQHGYKYVSIRGT